MSSKRDSMIEPTAMLLSMGIYVQFPRGECTIYLRQQGRASHKFHVYTPSNLAYLEWRHFCKLLDRNPNTYPCIEAADWLEADVKIKEALDLSERGFHVAPPRLDYVYIKGVDTALKNTPRYTIQEVTGTHRAVSVDTNRHLSSEQVQTLVKKVENSLLFKTAIWHADSKQLVVCLTEAAWSIPYRLASFALLVELTATV